MIAAVARHAHVQPNRAAAALSRLTAYCYARFIRLVADTGITFSIEHIGLGGDITWSSSTGDIFATKSLVDIGPKISYSDYDAVFGRWVQRMLHDGDAPEDIVAAYPDWFIA